MSSKQILSKTCKDIKISLNGTEELFEKGILQVTNELTDERLIGIGEYSLQIIGDIGNEYHYKLITYEVSCGDSIISGEGFIMNTKTIISILGTGAINQKDK